MYISEDVVAVHVNQTECALPKHGAISHVSVVAPTVESVLDSPVVSVIRLVQHRAHRRVQQPHVKVNHTRAAPGRHEQSPINQVLLSHTAVTMTTALAGMPHKLYLVYMSPATATTPIAGGVAVGESDGDNAALAVNVNRMVTLPDAPLYPST